MTSPATSPAGRTPGAPPPDAARPLPRFETGCWAAASVAVVVLLGCAADQPAVDGAGAAPAHGLAVVHSDYRSTAVSVVDPARRTLAVDPLIHSGSRLPGLTTALSGDVVAPQSPHPDGLVTLIDRYPNAVVTLVDPGTGAVVAQRSVATGFAANPHDLLYLPGRRTALLTRYERNRTPTPDPADLDEGDDLLLLTLGASGGLTISGRIDLTGQASEREGVELWARPDRVVWAGGLAWATLACLSPDYTQGGAAVLVGVDVEREVVAQRLEVGEAANCGGVVVAPAGDTLWLGCSGVFPEGREQQVARSGLVEVHLDPTGRPSLRRFLPAVALSGRPLGLDLALSPGGDWLFAIALGELDGAPDELLAISTASGQAEVLYRAEDAFALNGLLVDPGSSVLWAGVGDPRRPALHLFELGAQAPQAAGALNSNPAVGLPPRSIAPYLPAAQHDGGVPAGDSPDGGVPPVDAGHTPDGGDPGRGVVPDDVVSVRYGPGAGYGQEQMPAVVLDHPAPAPGGAASLDVLSLGDGGEIVLSFMSHPLVDGPGPDLQVFENVFLGSGDPRNPYADVGVVSVSVDGDTWHTFRYDYHPAGADVLARFEGFAGLRAGGDLFDLATVGLNEARYVRIQDAGAAGAPDTRLLDADGEFVDDPGNACCPGTSQGFDLDGVVGLSWR